MLNGANQMPWWAWLLIILAISAGVALAPRVAGLLGAFLPAAAP